MEGARAQRLAIIHTDKQKENQISKIKKKTDRKQTYPVFMEYYEPFNIAVFGLVSKEIQIH